MAGGNGERQKDQSTPQDETARPQAERLLAIGARWMRAIVILLRSDRTSVSPVRKFMTGALFVPFFAIWLVLLRLRAKWGGGVQLMAKTDSGMSLACRPPDLIQMYIYLFDIWEPDLTSYIRAHLTPGRVFVDVGANIGYFSLEAAQLVGPEGCVVAIEAAPWIGHELYENVVRNGQERIIRLVNKAVSDRQVDLDLYAGPVKNMGLTTTVASRGFKKRVTIEAAPLGSILTSEEIERAQIIKIDVEGAEVSVLDGMRPLIDTLAEDVDILIELSPAWWPDKSRTPDEVLQPFYDAGFNAYTLENNYWPWRYLWPNCVQPPRPVTHPLPDDVKRIDLLLTRS